MAKYVVPVMWYEIEAESAEEATEKAREMSGDKMKSDNFLDEMPVKQV